MIKKNIFLILLTLVIFNLSQTKVLCADNLAANSTYPDYSYEFAGKDSWEGFNRKIFVFNLKANKYVIRPINIIWASIMPQYGLDRIQGIYKNFNYPARLVGSLLQKDKESAGIETKRFFINTTIGLAGMYDPAKKLFKLEPRNEDMEQALAYHNVKQGPYLVLPIVTQGNTRDVGGWILDLPLNMCNYLFIIGPFSAISGGVSYLNDITLMQPLFKMADNYADPYEASKQLDAIEHYIKFKNLDRKEVLKQYNSPQNIIEVKNTSQEIGLEPDISLANYKSQGADVDTLRSMLFDEQNLNKSVWSELSIWNKSFADKLKTSSVNIYPLRKNYKYRYVLQKNKTAPLAIIYPSIGENINSAESSVQAKILYDEGFSVVILGSAFQWEFVKSMQENYRPGLPNQDAYYLRKTTLAILNNLEKKKDINPDKKVLVGTSFGALTGLFTASQEEKENTLGISKYIFINPPIETFFALKQIDKLFQSASESPDIKMQAAITDKKTVDVMQEVSREKNIETLPYTKNEADMAISFVMKQKLSDVVFTIENQSMARKNKLHAMINNMNFYDYANKYIMPAQNKSIEQLNYDASIYSISDFLKDNRNYTIYHSLDDCFVNQKQLKWLKQETGDRTIIFSNGSHLGYLYRPEFLNLFKTDVKN